MLLEVPYRVQWMRRGLCGRPTIATEDGSTVPMEFEYAASARRYVEAHSKAHPDRLYWVVVPWA